MIRITDLKLPIDHKQYALQQKVAKVLDISVDEIQKLHIFRRSLDARKKDNIHYVYVVDVVVLQEQKKLAKIKNKQITKSPDLTYHLPTGKCHMEKRPVVVGFGPAGLFASLLLAQMGLRPVVLERGGDVESRSKAVSHFWQTGELDTENNVQFGEGGAGTFSDGKLTTRIKDIRCRKVLEELVAAGAPKEILYDNKPHIGTDLLRDVVKQMRERIIALGGEVRFFTKLTDIFHENGHVTAVEVNGTEKIETNDVILALGHSARDTFTMLFEKQITLEQKPFAMGVRIEHPQSMVNAAQYGAFAEKLPAADYRLTYTTQKNRGVYTFCMCPGGYVVAASSEKGRLAVNGMSEHARDGKNANAAVLVQVFPEDFGSSHPLAGMYFQQDLEEKAFLAGGGNYTAPIQMVGQFLDNTEDGIKEVIPSYCPKTTFANMEEIFPAFMIEALKEGLQAFGKKLKGFDRPDAILTAVESRSSSPVRILRNAMRESVSLSGLYPIGEGAGYAGGIVSAAVDGVAVAEHIFEKYRI